MKKYFNYAFLGAIAFIGTFSFTACSSEDEAIVENNPTYDPVKGTVNTQFVLNIAAADQEKNNAEVLSTRSSATATQANGNNFRGMENVSILTYAQAANGKHLYDVSTDALATSTRNYDLSELLASGAISADNSRRVIELSLPVGTNTMLFYGKAPKPVSGNPSEYGNIDYLIGDKATDTQFSTHARITGNTEHFTATCNMLAAIMTRVANIGLHHETSTDVYGSKLDRDWTLKYWMPGLLDAPIKTVGGTPTPLTGDDLTNAETAGTYTDPGTNIVYTMKTVSGKDWRNYGTQYTSNKTVMKPLEEILGKAYVQLTSIRTVGGATEIRSGSGKGILSVIHDLWLVVDKVAAAEPTNETEFIAKKMAVRIRNRFTNYFVRDEAGVVTFKTLSELETAVNTYIRDVVTTNAVNPNNFPENLYLPDGAAQMTFDATANSNTGAFSYATNISVFKPLNTATSTVERFLYPAELVYFGNSPIRVSNEMHTTDNYPQTVANWDNDDYWVAANNLKNWVKDGVVSSTTRSVAMQRDINYGTALLATTVKYGAATIDDNQAACTEEVNDQHITVTNTSFKLTGVIIGGQCQKVGWNFLKKTVDGNDYNFMVYDNYIGTGGTGITIPASTTTTSDYNYTLLWDNYDAANNKQPVYVALEFVNNSGVDFWGNANLIRQGSKFYIVGKLDPSSKDYPAHSGTYIIPPYKNDGSVDNTQIRVFMQDFKTTASFTISANSLKKAYSTIPDLRSSQVSLGLAVDIQWESGLSFDVELGKTE